jgi:hypothetical protein
MTAVVAVSGLAGLAGAKGGVKVALGGVRTAIPLVAGENPMLDPLAVPEADARFTGTLSRLTLAGLDGARYPVKVQNVNRQVVSPCVTSLAMGSLSGTPAIIADPATAGATMVQLVGNVPVLAGSTARVDITCDWVDRKGVVQHHETHFAGTM